MVQLAGWEQKQREASQRLAESSRLAQELCSEAEAAAALQALESRLRAEGLSEENVAIQLNPQARPFHPFPLHRRPGAMNYYRILSGFRG